MAAARPARPAGELRPPRRRRLRPLLVLWHRWFGILAGAWLFVLGATGSALVFYQEIDRGLNPDLWRVEAPAGGPHDPLPVADLVAAATATHPGSYASYADLPDGPRDPAVVFLAPFPGSGLEIPAGLHVFVDPYTGRALGERVFGAFRVDRRHFAHFLYQLHMDLHLGPTASWLLGLLGFLWVLDHLPAALLSFPKLRKWKESFRVRWGKGGFRRLYGLHRATGLWLLPVTLALAVSGVYFNWYDAFRGAVDTVSPVTKRYYEVAPVLKAPVARPGVSPDRALDLARERAGGAEVDGLSLFPAQGLYWFRLFDERDLDPYGGRWIYVDMESGEIPSDRHVTEGSFGNAVLAWQFPLHSGKAFGWPGRIAVFLAGLAVCALSVTGFMVWWRKRRGRNGGRRRAGEEPEARPESATRRLAA